MSLKEVMVESVITVESNAKVRDAVKLMNDNEIGCLIVKTKEEPVGIITERDILKRIVHESNNAEQVRVSEIMTKPLVVGNIDMKLEEGVKLMLKQNLKKLPIVEDKRLVGLITLTDVVRVDHAGFMFTRVIKQLMKDGWLPPKRMDKVIGLYIA